MKIIKYIKNNNKIQVSLLFDDNTYAEYELIDNGRSKAEILKDAYIILKSANRTEYKSSIDTLEDFILEERKVAAMNADFYSFTGNVYDQYGDIMNKTIEYSIEGTNKAKIVNKQLILDEVEEDTPFTIVAKCGSLIERQDRMIYAKVKEEQTVTREEYDELKQAFVKLVGGTQ